jgi:predicted aconitase with swiveling domain
MAGAALCISRGSGISEGGTALFSALYRGGGPACILLAEPAGPSVVSGAVLARVWLGRAVPTIDRLGAEFLYAVRDGGAVSVFEDGTVIVA